MIVRQMKPNELDSTLILIDYLAEQAGIESKDYNHILKTVRNYTIKADHCWLNAYEGSRPIGCIGGYLIEDNWLPQYHAHIQYFYVLESHALTQARNELYLAFAEWAKTMGAKNLIAGDVFADLGSAEQDFEALDFQSKTIWRKE